VFDSENNKESNLMAEHQRMLREKLGLKDNEFEMNRVVSGGVPSKGVNDDLFARMDSMMRPYAVGDRMVTTNTRTTTIDQTAGSASAKNNAVNTNSNSGGRNVDQSIFNSVNAIGGSNSIGGSVFNSIGGGEDFDLSSLTGANTPDYDTLDRARQNRMGSGRGGGGGYDRRNDPRGGDNGLNRGPDQTQINSFLSSDAFAEESQGTTVLAAQCKTTTSFVPVHCGDVVSISLDAEDSCLANNFRGNEHSFMTRHKFSQKDFQGSFRDRMVELGFSTQGFVGQTSFDVLAVRGTSVVLEVLAEDECGNVGRGFDEPARDCDTFVSGRCCPPVANALSQFARDQVLGSIDGGFHDPLGSFRPIQLADIKLKP